MKNITLFHLNTERFRFLKEIKNFITDSRPDIINFQEVSDGDWSTFISDNRIREIISLHGYHATYFPYIGVKNHENLVQHGIATLSRYPIIDSHWHFFDNTQYREITPDHPWLGNDRNQCYIENFEMPQWFLSTLIDIDGQLVRNINTHLHVTLMCTDSQQIIKEAQEIVSYYKSCKNIPTVLTGDFNIQYESATLSQLKKIFTCHSQDLTNTLEKTVHPLFTNQPGHPGLAVDHVWSNDSLDVQASLVEKKLSDHKAIWCNISLISEK